MLVLFWVLFAVSFAVTVASANVPSWGKTLYPSVKAKLLARKILQIAKHHYPSTFAENPCTLKWSIDDATGWLELRARKITEDKTLVHNMTVQMDFVEDVLSCVWYDIYGNTIIATAPLRGDHGQMTVSSWPKKTVHTFNF